MLLQIGQFAIINAVLATGLALGVWCLSTWIRRPALLHLLWVLVLVRLVMPPVFLVNASPVRAWFATQVQSSSESAVAFSEEPSTRELQWWQLAEWSLSQHSLIPIRGNGEEQPDSGTLAMAAKVPTLWTSMSQRLASWRSAFAAWWPHALRWTLCLWLCGSALFFVAQWTQVVLFRRRIERLTYRSRTWQARLEKVAQRMGLQHHPNLYLVRANISPMLWGYGRRTRILFPERLLKQLDAKAQNTLLAHELAHYRRGDQWVRLLEMVCTSLFWWHPVAWWAVREVERTEEFCCDAWALKLADGCPRTYAEALLAALDFVSLPPAACGASHEQLMAQRLTAIMCQRRIGNWFTPDAFPSVWALSLLVLLPTPFFAGPIWQKLSLPNSPALAALQPIVEPHAPETDTNRAAAHALELSITAGQRASLYHAESGRTLDLGVGVVASAGFSADGGQLAIGTLQGGIDLYDSHTAEKIRHIQLNSTAIRAISFSPDASQLAVGTGDGICRLLQLSASTATEIVREEPGSSVDCVRFSPDGQHAAVLWTRKSGQRVEIWDLVAGRVAASLKDQQDIVSLAPSSVGRGSSWLLVRRNGALQRWSSGGSLRPLPREVPDATLRQLRVVDLDESELLQAGS